MKSSFCIDLQRFMLIPTKFPLSQKKYYVILAQVLRITLQSITYYFAKYHVMLSLLYFLVFFISLLDLSFFIAQKDTFLIFYL